MADCMTEYAVCMLDAGGSVRNWNTGAERVLGYSDPEIIGQSYSRFFTKEDLLSRLPEKLLDQARFSGRAVEEGWRVRKGGGRFQARTTLLVVRNSQGGPVGCLMVLRDLTQQAAPVDADIRV
jgi:PAS domain S-box-containing protein